MQPLTTIYSLVGHTYLQVYSRYRPLFPASLAPQCQQSRCRSMRGDSIARAELHFDCSEAFLQPEQHAHKCTD